MIKIVWVHVACLLFFADKLVNFQPVVKYNDLYLYCIGLVAFVTQCQLLHLLRYNKNIAILGATISQSGKELLSFGVFTFIIILAFGSGAYLMFYEMVEYSSVPACLASLVQAFLGKFNFQSLMYMYGTGACYYLLIYLLTTIVVVMNFFIAILNDYLALVARSKSLQNKDFAVVDHFFETIKDFIVGKKQNSGVKLHSNEVCKIIMSIR